MADTHENGYPRSFFRNNQIWYTKILILTEDISSGYLAEEMLFCGLME